MPAAAAVQTVPGEPHLVEKEEKEDAGQRQDIDTPVFEHTPADLIKLLEPERI